MIVEWVRRDDGALLSAIHDHTLPSSVHHHTQANVYVNDREKSASLPSSRLYTISSLSSF